MSGILDELPDLHTLPTALPLFTANGGLGEGDFAPSRLDFERRFVTTGRASRRRLYEGWDDHRQALLTDGLSPTSRQLIDRSFTTAKTEPGDVDLAAEVPLAFDQRPPRPDEPICRLLLGAITKRLKDAGELMGITLLDHIIFGERSYASFADDGLL